MRAPALPLWALALGFVLATPFLSGSSSLTGQEPRGSGEARKLDAADEAALEDWARSRLAEIAAEAGDGPLGMGLQVERLWALYFLSVGEEDRIEDAEELLQELRTREPPRPSDGLLAGFQGALEVVRAKHAFWPPSKLKHLRRGVEALDREVGRSPEDLRLRYLRLMSCFYLPFFLDQDDSVAEDMERLISDLPERAGAFPPFLARGVALFLLQHGDTGPEERIRLLEVAG